MTKYLGRTRAKPSEPTPRGVDHRRYGGHSPEEERMRQEAFGRSRAHLPDDEDTPEPDNEEARR